ncbi:nitroreductase family deazaflavin-dependent oxidoreductase [Micromonospora sp. WMMD1082]|uniref:nitroreductase family deazaflavin-dependent oxidoreductase n=1 Tax=Micromonospora sp. WMMD1082 TaxID=3016104 RepID=UPI002417298F|nr:nitroreductase family deazaflavin-dependent oxidoreductase [Micromonospora sp. WMMD1082]MDG4798311.1 nitroreductase family deazaflavin-dependent oxidoreductase [Micromonospora sp. WMMD1082]
MDRVSGSWLYRVKQWMYRGGRPNWLARAMNRVSAWQFSTGFLAPGNWVTLEVVGRRSGRTVSFPLVAVDHDGGRYLVSMLGEQANWVRNVRAAGGRAVLRRDHRQSVLLAEVPVAQRAPILRHYLDKAPGARPHVPVRRGAPMAQFAQIAADYPVFQVLPAPGHAARSGGRG